MVLENLVFELELLVVLVFELVFEFGSRFFIVKFYISFVK